MVVSGVRLEVRRCKHVRHPELERRVYHAVGHGTRMTSKAEILRKTVEIAKEINVKEFERSDNWVARFINQHGLDTVLSRRGKNTRVVPSLDQPCAEPTVIPFPSYTSCVSSSSSDSLPCAYFRHEVLHGNEAFKESAQFHVHEAPQEEWRAIAPQKKWQCMAHQQLTTAQPSVQTTPATKDVLDELDKTFLFCWEEHFNDKWGWNGETGW